MAQPGREFHARVERVLAFDDGDGLLGTRRCAAGRRGVVALDRGVDSQLQGVFQLVLVVGGKGSPGAAGLGHVVVGHGGRAGSCVARESYHEDLHAQVLVQVIGGKNGLAVAAGGHRVVGGAGGIVADVVAVAVHVARPVGRAVGDQQQVVVATGDGIFGDVDGRSGEVVAVLDRLHVVVRAGQRGLADVVLQRAARGRPPVGEQPAVGGIGHLVSDGLGRVQRIVGVVRGVEKGRELRIPAAAT